MLQYDDIFREFSKGTVPHSRGFFILAPSGTGKTYFITHQVKKNWIDGDKLWVATGAHPDRAWWTEGLEVIKMVDAQSDAVTEEAKKRGFWIMGASNSYLVPDAVVLPPWEENVEYIRKREQGNYDGGLKTSQLEQLKSHREEIENMSKNKNVPIFKSIPEAVSFLEDIYKNNEKI